MKKMTTLFKKDLNDLSRVINEIAPENEWVLKHGIPTRKFDGSACMILDNTLYRRYDARINKKTGKYKRKIPDNCIPCQEPDFITGHHPHWKECKPENHDDKFHLQAFEKLEIKENGIYEICGVSFQGNPEKVKTGNVLIKHSSEILDIADFSFESIKAFLGNQDNDIEGIVFYSKIDNRMCKIRKSDFGFKRK